MSIHSVIVSTGSYLPAKVLTNQDLEKMVETSDEWIVQRSGISERRIAAENETTSDLAIKAARSALGDIDPATIDGIIVATTTPDQTFPAVAVKVQAALGISPCPAFDVQGVCTGFIYAMSVADAMIKTGACKRMLVVGAEKMSSILDWTDRTTCVLFADGAGAVILEASENKKAGIISTHLYADGSGRDLLYADDHIVMNGREVFKYAVKYMSDVVGEVLEQNNMTGADIDWLVPHQANIRIIEATAKKLDMPMERVITTVQKHGNTSAASIPLAFHEGVSQGKIKRGDVCLLEAMGGGFTWGAVLLRF